jgi:pimeloyl-ACP methyl ester carboxylesterase
MRGVFLRPLERRDFLLMPLLGLVAREAMPTLPAIARSERWQMAPPAIHLPPHIREDMVEHVGAHIWSGMIGSGPPVLLLHGGLVDSSSWGNQVPALIGAGFKVILIDSRGHGRSSLGADHLDYELMASDVVAVLDMLHLKKVSVVGWSDGAIISLILAMQVPDRIDKVYAFGANMEVEGIKNNPDSQPIIKQILPRIEAEYRAVSQTPNNFAKLASLVNAMQHRSPYFTGSTLSEIDGRRVAIVDGDHEEFIAKEHTLHLAASIPESKLIELHGVSHFAPWQDPDQFNQSMLSFLSTGI